MGMTYIIGKEKKLSDEILLTINVNSTVEAYISSLISYLFEKSYPDIYEQIVEQIIFMRFDELSKQDFHFVIDQINRLSSSLDYLLEDVKNGIYWWNKLIKPLVDRDYRIVL
ncbi:hypothetical protein VXR09_00970 [Acinetobacter baumannii]|uniref:hypothetical protein n=1 Tax=Acinetobacter baumannii TaxID=470 RepID=UPI0023425B50|nr:hypothetical protein [Acinetobacter baumannii]EHU1481498.1 hypothetical protein [Acinetobacter baumannii]EHU2701897.1 hypothetical protein [Acinetobacter baumannii]MDC5178888.1 hypothetical protein [Acinetobacter baumannii]MDH2493980.1 hypothetical protein [Acinetobacter baumannii]MDN8341802.1 hypothetical protein [Acinetobacter baumannii]